jgi:hypothetical protein
MKLTTWWWRIAGYPPIVSAITRASRFRIAQKRYLPRLRCLLHHRNHRILVRSLPLLVNQHFWPIPPAQGSDFRLQQALRTVLPFPKHANLQRIDGRSQMGSGLPRVTCKHRLDEPQSRSTIRARSFTPFIHPFQGTSAPCLAALYHPGLSQSRYVVLQNAHSLDKI